MMKEQNKIYLGIGIVAIILIAAIAMFLTPKGEETIKIGVLAPLTGSVSHLGNPYVRGMELAVDEVNMNGGINGKQVELLIEDTKLDGTESVNAVNKLLSIENPDVFTVLFAIPSQAVAPILEDAKKPFIYDAYIRSIAENNHYAFKANYDPLEGCELLANYIDKNKNYDNWGILMPRGEFSELCLQGIKKVKQDIDEYWYDIGETDFRTLLSKANNNGNDLVFTMCLGQECVNIPKQLSELNYPIKIAAGAIASESIFPSVIKSSSSEVLQGIVSVDFVPIHNITDSEFAQKYSERYPDPTPVDLSYGAVGYEEIMILSEAMKNCGSGENDCLVKSLETVKNYKSILGSHGFEDHILQLNMNLYEFDGSRWQLITSG